MNTSPLTDVMHFWNLTALMSKIHRALISVSDKTGLVTFAKLAGDGWRDRMVAAELARLRSQA